MAVLWHPKRRIFVTHIPKCGGTSIMRALARHGFEVRMRATGHIRVEDIYRIAHINPDYVSQYIAVLRNPYERELSHWLFETEMFRCCRDVCNRFRFAAQHETVNSYVKDPLAKFAFYYEQDWYPDLYPMRPPNLADYVLEKEVYRYWLTLEDEIPQTMRFVRLENIDEELPAVLGHDVEIPTGINSTEHGDWQTYFDNRGKQTVQRLYWWTFDRFYDRWGRPTAFESWKEPVPA